MINYLPTFVHIARLLLFRLCAYTRTGLELHVLIVVTFFVFSRSSSSYLSLSESTKQTEPMFATTYKLVSYGVQIQLVEKLCIDTEYHHVVQSWLAHGTP